MDTEFRYSMSDLVEPFQAIDDAELRVVAALGSLDYEIQYIRDDLAKTYDEETFEDAYRSIVANQVSADDFRQTVGFTGLRCQLLLFEENVVFLFPSSRYDSVFVSFDRADPFPMHAVVEAAGTIPHVSDESTD